MGEKRVKRTGQQLGATSHRRYSHCTQFFYGVCLAFLGSTGILLLFNSPYHTNQFLCAASYPGIECTPSYIENIHPTAYSPVIRNLLYGALILNAPLMLFVFAILPHETILGGANVLSVLADHVVGKWFRIVIVVDCIFVLAAESLPDYSPYVDW